MKKSKARGIVTILALLSVVCVSSCSTKQQAAEPKGYKTPEKAVEAYLDGFKKMDLDQMTSAFAIDIYVDNYDFEGIIDYLHAYVYATEVKLPNATDLARDLNAEGRRSNISSAILRQYVTLARPGFNLMDTQPFKEEGQAAEFTEHFEQKLGGVKCDTIKLLGFIPPEELSEYYNMDKNQENIARRGKICGADEMQSCAAVFEIGGDEYLMCVDVVNYGGKWYLAELGGNLGALLGVDIMSAGLLPVSGLDLDSDWEDLLVPAS